MPPGHVRTLEDYWIWLEKLIDGSGGFLGGPGLEVEVVLHERDDSLVGLVVPRQRIIFPSGAFLEVRLRVNEQLVAEEYNFHHQAAAGDFLWRKDKHPGHEDLGGPEHIHRDPGDPDRAEPYQEVDLEEALGQVWAHLTT